MNPEVAAFTSATLNTLTLLASLVASLFLIKGAYLYITSTGKPEALEDAKKTIRNALIGLVLILSANALVSLLQGALTTPAVPSSSSELTLLPIEPITPVGGLTQVLLEAISSLLQNIIQSATQPITESIIGFLTTTPALVTNSVVFNFWLVVVGITNALFVLLIAVLGFQLMSASSFGFEELELKQVLPKIGLAFLGANTSLFLIDWIIRLNNTLIEAIINATGGINQAWLTNAFDPASLVLNQVAFITHIFMLLFVILAIVLLLFYITRLITLVLGAVLSPLVFLLWALPKFSDVAEVSAKTYLTTIFSLFIHVIIIQLAASFLTLPGQVGTNPLMSILIGVGLLLTLIKTQSFMVQLMFYNSSRALFRKMSGQMINVLNAKSNMATTKRVVTTPRKVVQA